MVVAADGGRIDLGPGSLRAPFGPVLPPRAGAPFALGPPLLRIFGIILAGHVPRLGRRRVDDAGDVATAGQHEPGVAADVPQGRIRRGPRNDVVVDRGDHVQVLVHVAQVEPHPAYLEV